MTALLIVKDYGEESKFISLSMCIHIRVMWHVLFLFHGPD